MGCFIWHMEERNLKVTEKWEETSVGSDGLFSIIWLFDSALYRCKSILDG